MLFQDDRNRERRRGKGGPSLFAPRSYINAHIQTRQLLSVCINYRTITLIKALRVILSEKNLMVLFNSIVTNIVTLPIDVSDACKRFVVESFLFVLLHSFFVKNCRRSTL